MKSRTCYSLMTAGMLALCGCTSAAGPGPATEAPLLQAQATFGPVASGEANAAILVRDPADAAHRYVVAAAGLGEIGRAACRGRVCQIVSITVVAGSLKKK